MNESTKSRKAQALEEIRKIPLPLSRKDFYRIERMMGVEAVHYFDLPENFKAEYLRVNEEIGTELQKDYGMSDYE